MLLNLKYVVLVCSILLLIFSKKQDMHEYKISGLTQGTTYNISYFATDSLVKKSQIDSILNVIDLSMSLYDSTSIITKFNQSASGVIVDRHFAKVIKKSIKINKATKGLFDVTVAPLVQLWGFGPQKIKYFPDSNSISAIMPCIGMDKLVFKNYMLLKTKSCVKIDLNGIAQGYTVDVVANFLIKTGIKSFMVEVGGEIRVLGLKPTGKSFKIGIEGPVVNQYNEATIKHVITFKNGAVTTSGNYAKYLNYGKQKISHLINAKTGYPLQNEMISVTVFAKDAITADGYDNALMAMQLQEALNFVNNRKELEAYFIYKKTNGEIADTLTTGFKKLILN